MRPDKYGAVDSPPILRRLGLRETPWSRQVQGIKSRYWRVIGTVAALHRPHPRKDALRYRVEAARKLLTAIGVTP